MNRIKKGDQVVVIAGKDKGKRGTVLNVFPASERVVVENINIAKCHTRPNPPKGIQGGIVEQEKPINIANIALWNPATKKADRIGFRSLEDGRKVRYFKSNSEVVDV